MLLNLEGQRRRDRAVIKITYLNLKLRKKVLELDGKIFSSLLPRSFGIAYYLKPPEFRLLLEPFQPHLAGERSREVAGWNIICVMSTKLNYRRRNKMLGSLIGGEGSFLLMIQSPTEWGCLKDLLEKSSSKFYKSVSFLHTVCRFCYISPLNKDHIKSD